jgi:hypothetical protein
MTSKKGGRGMKSIDDTALIPEIVAERVSQDEKFIAWACAKARHIYPINNVFRKGCNSQTGNAYLYMFMEHWHEGWKLGRVR